MDKRGSEAARAAWLYYIEELTQGEVADELGVSRSTVVRLLRRAKETGLVRISLDVPRDVFEMERELERLYGLRRVRLVPEAGDDAPLKRWLGHAASEIVVEIVGPGSTVAVGWGTTMREITASLSGEHTIDGVRIVPLAGGLHRASSGTNSYWVAEQLGRYFHAPTQALYAPLFVEDISTAEALRRDPDIGRTLELARQASLVIFSVGTLDDEATIIQLEYLSSEERRLLQERGAAGDIVCRWIDSQGRKIEPPPNINPVGVSLEDIRNIPERLLVAGGELKREIILGAIRGGYVTTLVTDDSTAAYLLEQVTDTSKNALNQAIHQTATGPPE